MKINNFFAFNFQKKLKAQGAVRTQKDSKDVRIFHLDKFHDLNEFDKAQKTRNWQGNYYLNDVVAFKKDLFKRYDFYSMEDDDENILCYCVLDNNRPKRTKLIYLETAPRLSCYNPFERPYKYIGETMMAFIATISGDKKFVIPTVAERKKTQDFYYKNCNFHKKGLDSAELNSDKFDKLIKSNATHTGKKLQIVG